MVTSNALRRTFRLLFGESCGTCFSIDVDSRQYLVTARHVLPGASPQVSVQIQHQGRWKVLECRLVGLGSDDVDVAVLAPPHPISPSLPLRPTVNDLYVSQDAYFLGYPFGLHSDIGPLNAEFPLPLVKRACVSMFSFADGRVKYMLLDGRNNPGFSGGPVVYSAGHNASDACVAAIVSAYRFEWDNVYMDGNPSPLQVKYNTGIVIAYSIDHALALINANPIGAEIAISGA